MRREPTQRLLAGGLVGLAVGRLALGVGSRATRRAMARLLRVGDADTPELAYMTRVFGIRAVALGAGYLLSEGDARRLWQRLAFGCDISDTLAGIGHLHRRDLPVRSASALTALTGAYALIGGAKVIRDLRGS